jgi:hypothetical protein
MKTAGRRTEPAIVFHASAALLRTGALFNDELQRIAGGCIRLIPKGVYRFKTHEEADKHWQQHSINEIVRRNTR